MPQGELLQRTMWPVALVISAPTRGPWPTLQDKVGTEAPQGEGLLLVLAVEPGDLVWGMPGSEVRLQLWRAPPLDQDCSNSSLQGRSTPVFGEAGPAPWSQSCTELVHGVLPPAGS